MTKLDEKLAALTKMSPSQLRGGWLQLFGVAAPVVGHRLLALGLAHRLQEKRLGGLPPKLAREVETMVRQLDRGGELKANAVATLKPGTRLIREWRGATHQVLLLDDGYLYQDQRAR
jgi:hypothetical protein